MRVTMRHLVLIGGVLAVPACQDNQQDIAAPRARDVRVSESTGAPVDASRPRSPTTTWWPAARAATLAGPQLVPKNARRLPRFSMPPPSCGGETFESVPRLAARARCWTSSQHGPANRAMLPIVRSCPKTRAERGRIHI